jgi:hypothetical protein
MVLEWSGRLLLRRHHLPGRNSATTFCGRAVSKRCGQMPAVSNAMLPNG